MKQVLQNLRSGETTLVDVPAPIVTPGHVLIRTRCSLISAGTERMLVEFGKASLFAKAKAQPDKVKQVFDKIRSDGLLTTVDAVLNRLDEPLPLGYCNAGVVVGVGADVENLKPGDRVASNGPHAEFVSVGKNLCSKVPDGVTDAQAAATVLGSIGLQGVRLAVPQIGERFVVYGLGLIGLLTIQILRANGCEVLGVDLDSVRLRLAEGFGALVCDVSRADPVAAAMSFSGGLGVDGVLVTASAKTDDIVHNAAQMCRKRGRIVLVGVVGLNLRRADFYEKELSFQVSCSYGPGRYDESYEKNGQDYPFGFVRWTEQRNLEAVLELMRTGRLVVDGLITQRFPIGEAEAAYQAITGGGEALGVVLEYPGTGESSSAIAVRAVIPNHGGGSPRIGVIGAGNFSKMTLLPALSKTSAVISYVADLDGAAARHAAAKFNGEKVTTDVAQVLGDPAVDAVVIAVGHNLHCRFICDALAAGKHCFVEKPLAMNPEEVAEVVSQAEKYPNLAVTLGFNRRFSPHISRLKSLLSGRSEPLAMTMTVNAGIIPPQHWVHDPVRGGGRIIGEACHFLDLLAFLAGSRITSVSAVMMGGGVAVHNDKMSITLSFEDGSIGSVNYFANGPKVYPKETLEVFSEGRVARVDNFQQTTGFGFKGFRKFRTRRQDKGHAGELAAFIEGLSAGIPEIVPLEESVNATLASFAVMTAAEERRTVSLAEEYGGIFSAGQAGGLGG